MPVEQVIEARTRDLGGFSVGRVLPAIARRFVGPFAFLDHMGPTTNHLAVRAHPHINLATVTYLFEGEVMHRDSVGSVQAIRPGAINWMSAGRGIAHSERGEPGTTHGLQLWVGLPRAHEDSDPEFQHHPAEALPAIEAEGVAARVLVGEAFGARSPVRTLSPMFYADARLAAGARLELPAYRERAVYVLDGAVTVDGTPIAPRVMATVAPGAAIVTADVASRVVVLGGEPLDGPRYIWWNFVSSSQARIIEAAEAWRAGRFAPVPGETELIPAPDNPHFRE